MLNENINKYYELKMKMESIKKEMETIYDEIITEMGDEKEHSTDEGIVAKCITKETFKYNDEPAMIKYLKENGMSSYVVEKVNTTSMNKELKKGLSLTESLNSWYTKTVSHSLSVDKK